MCSAQCMILKKNFDLSVLQTETPILEFCVSPHHPSPPHQPLHLPGFSTVTSQYLLETAHQRTMQYVELQETIHQALIDNGGVGSSSKDIPLSLQDEISKILGNFRTRWLQQISGHDLEPEG